MRDRRATRTSGGSPNCTVRLGVENTTPPTERQLDAAQADFYRPLVAVRKHFQATAPRVVRNFSLGSSGDGRYCRPRVGSHVAQFVTGARPDAVCPAVRKSAASALGRIERTGSFCRAARRPICVSTSRPTISDAELLQEKLRLRRTCVVSRDRDFSIACNAVVASEGNGRDRYAGGY